MPGSQGRFLASMFWTLIKNRRFINNKPNTLNSWHKDDDYVLTTIIDNYTSDNFYDELIWKHRGNLAFYRSHYYPDWQKLNSDKFKNTKFIIIHIGSSDLKECVANEWYKNCYAKLKGFDLSIQNINHNIYTMFQRMYGELPYDEFISRLNPSNMQPLIERAAEKSINWWKSSVSIDPEKRINFVFPEVPAEFASRTLIIDYNDIHTKSTTGYVALDKLMEFSKPTVNEDVLTNIINYFDLNAQKRSTMIDEYMYNLNITK